MSYSNSSEIRNRNVLVYVKGGLTYSEVKAVHDFNARTGFNVIVGADKMTRSEQFIGSLLESGPFS